MTTIAYFDIWNLGIVPGNFINISELTTETAVVSSDFRDYGRFGGRWYNSQLNSEQAITDDGEGA